MTQKTVDLLAALRKKDVGFILADDIKGAIDAIESVMGQCWTDASGSRHVARKMLECDYVVDTKHLSSITKQYVDKAYIPVEGEVIYQLHGYRPITVAERQERAQQQEVISRRDAKAVRRETRLRLAHRASPKSKSHVVLTDDQWIDALEGAHAKQPEVSSGSRFLEPGDAERFHLGHLSLG